jgi:hypothetical protein
VSDFWSSDSGLYWGGDWAQNRRLREMSDDLNYVSSALSSAQSSQRRLKAELSKVRGSLEQRLDRLSAAFDAFVEISDLRVTLGLFHGQGRVRHQARQLLTKNPLDGQVSDVDGYWLPPALSAMLVAIDGVLDTEAMDLARARDDRRTAVFFVLGTMVLGGRQTVTDDLLGAALPELAAEVPTYQRAVWTLLADGFFGTSGWELARERGRTYLAGLSDEDKASAVAEMSAIATPAVATTTVSAPRKLDGIAEVVGSLKACEQLSGLVRWTADALAGFTNEPEIEADPLVRATLEMLVNEGSPVEQPLLNRERDLRAVIEANGAGAVGSGWESPVGTTLDMLRDDVRDTEHAGRRALAIRITGPHILAAGEKYAEIARRPVPPKVNARTRHGMVTITAAGPEPASLAAAAASIREPESTAGQRQVVAWVLFGLTAVLVVAGIFAGAGWFVPALGVLGIGAWQYVKAHQERAEAKAQVVYLRESFEADVAKQVEEFVSVRDKLLDRQANVDADITELRSVLTD